MVYRPYSFEFGGNPLANDDPFLTRTTGTEFGGSPSGLDLAGYTGNPLGLQGMQTGPDVNAAALQEIQGITTAPLAPPRPQGPQGTMFYSPSTGEMIVNGYRFNQRNASRALASEEFAAQPPRQFNLPDDVGDWREMPVNEYSSYIDSIRNPGIGRRLSEGWEHAWRSFGDTLGLGPILAVDPDNEWALRQHQNVLQAYEENAPFMLRLQDIHDVGDGVEYFAQMAVQGIPWLTETAVSMVGGGLIGAAVGGGVGGPTGAIEGFIAKEAMKRAAQQAVQTSLRNGASAVLASMERNAAGHWVIPSVERAVATNLASPDEVQRFLNFATRAYSTARGSQRGQVAAMFGTNYLTGVGDIRNTLADAGVDPTSAESAGWIWGGAVPYALMESMGDLVITAPITKLIPGLGRGPSHIGNAVRGALFTAGAESVEELGQYGLTESARSQMTGEEPNFAPIDLLEVGVAGGIAGLGLGGVVGAFGEKVTPTPTTPPAATATEPTEPAGPLPPSRQLEGRQIVSGPVAYQGPGWYDPVLSPRDEPGPISQSGTPGYTRTGYRSPQPEYPPYNPLRSMDRYEPQTGPMAITPITPAPTAEQEYQQQLQGYIDRPYRISGEYHTTNMDPNRVLVPPRPVEPTPLNPDQYKATPVLFETEEKRRAREERQKSGTYQEKLQDARRAPVPKSLQGKLTTSGQAVDIETREPVNAASRETTAPSGEQKPGAKGEELKEANRQAKTERALEEARRAVAEDKLGELDDKELNRLAQVAKRDEKLLIALRQELNRRQMQKGTKARKRLKKGLEAEGKGRFVSGSAIVTPEIEEKSNAVQERSTEEIPVREQPERSEGVREAHAERQEAAEESKEIQEAKQEELTTPEKRELLALDARISNTAPGVAVRDETLARYNELAARSGSDKFPQRERPNATQEPVSGNAKPQEGRQKSQEKGQQDREAAEVLSPRLQKAREQLIAEAKAHEPRAQDPVQKATGMLRSAKKIGEDELVNSDQAWLVVDGKKLTKHELRELVIFLNEQKKAAEAKAASSDVARNKFHEALIFEWTNFGDSKEFQDFVLSHKEQALDWLTTLGAKIRAGVATAVKGALAGKPPTPPTAQRMGGRNSGPRMGQGRIALELRANPKAEARRVRRTKLFEFIQQVTRANGMELPQDWQQQIVNISDGVFKSAREVKETLKALTMDASEVGREARAYTPLRKVLPKDAKMLRDVEFGRVKAQKAQVSGRDVEVLVTLTPKDALGTVKAIQKRMADNLKFRTIHVFANAQEFLDQANNEYFITPDGNKVSITKFLTAHANAMARRPQFKDWTFEQRMTYAANRQFGRGARALRMPFFDALIVFTDEVRTHQELMRVLEHEWPGHFGLSVLFNGDAEAKQSFLRRFAQIPGMQAKRMQLLREFSGYNLDPEHLQYEEVIMMRMTEGPLALEKLLSAPEAIDPVTRKTLWQEFVELVQRFVRAIIGDLRTPADRALDIVTQALKQHAITGERVDLNKAIEQFLDDAVEEGPIEPVTAQRAVNPLPLELPNVVKELKASIFDSEDTKQFKRVFSTRVGRLNHTLSALAVGRLPVDRFSATRLKQAAELANDLALRWLEQFPNNPLPAKQYKLLSIELNRTAKEFAEHSVPLELPPSAQKMAAATLDPAQATRELLFGTANDKSGRPYENKEWATHMGRILTGVGPIVQKAKDLGNKGVGTAFQEAWRKIGRTLEPLNNMANRSMLIKQVLRIMRNTMQTARAIITEINEDRDYAIKAAEFARYRAIWGDKSPGSTAKQRRAYSELAINATLNKLPKLTEEFIREQPRVMVRHDNGMLTINYAAYDKMLKEAIISKEDFAKGLKQYVVEDDGKVTEVGTATVSQEVLDAGYELYVRETTHMARSALRVLEHATMMMNMIGEHTVDQLIYDTKLDAADEPFFREMLHKMLRLYSDIAFHIPIDPKTGKPFPASRRRRNFQKEKAKQVLVELMRSMHEQQKVLDWTDMSRTDEADANNTRKNTAFKWRNINNPHHDVAPFVNQIKWFLENDRLQKMNDIYTKKFKKDKQPQYDMLGAFQGLLNTETQVYEEENDLIQSVMGNYVEFTRQGEWRVYVEVRTADGKQLADIGSGLKVVLPVSYVKSEREAKELQDDLMKELEGSHTTRNTVGDPIPVTFDVRYGKAPVASTLAEAPKIKEFLKVAQLTGIKFNPNQMRQIANLLENAAGRKRFGLQRQGTPGFSADILRNNNDTMMKRAWKAAKMSQAWMLESTMNDLKNIKGDWDLLQKLQDDFDIADRGAPAGQPVPSSFVRNEEQVYITEQRLLRYAEMLRHMADTSKHRPHVIVRTTKGERKLKIMGEGRAYHAHAVAMQEALKANALEVSLDDIISKTGQIRLLAVVNQLGSIASGAMNSLTTLTHLPVRMMARHPNTGYGEGFDFNDVIFNISKAFQDVGLRVNMVNSAIVKQMLDDAKAGKNPTNLTIPELEFFYEQTLEGIFQPNQTYSLSGGVESNLSSLILRNLAEMFMSPFAGVESSNRRVAGLTLYRMIKARYIAAGVKEELLNDHDSAEYKQMVEDINNVIFDSHGDYSNVNQPKALRGSVAKFVLLYKMFPIMTTALLHNLPPPQQAAMLFMLFIMGGVKGEPFAEDIMDLYDTLLQKLGVKHDSVELQMVNFFEDVMPGSSQWIMRGALDPFAFGGTMSTRVGLGDIIPFTGALREGADFGRELETLAGPVWASSRASVEWSYLLAKYVAQLVGLREDTMSGAELIRRMPQAQVRGIGEAYLQMMDHQITDRDGRLISDNATFGSMLTRAMGFYPLEATKAHDAVRLDRMHTGYMRSVRARYILAFADAYRAGNEAQMERITNYVSTWNDWARDANRDDMLIRNFRSAAVRAGRAAASTTIERAEESAPHYSLIDELAQIMNADEESD